MAAQGSFEDLIAWQKARVLVRILYSEFGASKDFGFRDQVLCAVVSVMTDIAEGFECGTKKEFRRYLFIAKASCGEVRSLLFAAHDIQYLSLKRFQDLKLQATEVSKILSGLIKSVR